MKTFKKTMILFLILGIGIVMGCVDSSDEYSSSAPTSYDEPEPTNICKYDWEWSTTRYIGKYSEAPAGYKYAVVNLYILNTADTTISTNAYDWTFVGNGVAYTHDSTTYADEISHQSVDVLPWGEFTTQIVYLVDEDVNTAGLYYDDPYVKLERIDYFTKLREESKPQTKEEVYDDMTTTLRNAGYNVVSVDIRDEALKVDGEFKTYKTMVFTIPTEEDAVHLLDMAAMYSTSADAFMTVAEEDTSSKLYSEYFVSDGDVYAYKHHTIAYDNIEVCTHRKEPLDLEDYLKLFE